MSHLVRAQSFRFRLRPLLAASFGTALAGVAICSLAGACIVGSSIASGALSPQPQFSALKAFVPPAPPGPDANAKLERVASLEAAMLAAAEGKAERLADEASEPADGSAARFEAIVAKASLTPQKLAALFGRAEPQPAQGPAVRALALASAPQPVTTTNAPAIAPASGVMAAASPAPALERLAASAPAGAAPTASMPVTDAAPRLLAFADPAPASEAGAALSTLLLPPEADMLASLGGGLADDGDISAFIPQFEDTPSDGPTPDLRPRAERRRDAVETARPEADEAEEAKPDRRRSAERGAKDRNKDRNGEKPTLLALARPDNPSDKSDGGRTLRDLFGRAPRAGNGVAVYDISAAKVYMPDGSVLEAHSGIGKMADNPRYVHVKMNGPTPPHTYNLKMREKRFHGVEAIRMLPVDGKNKHGRDGFLTHSYLLRGGRAESHGCVAFKDYENFLRAFKQGKVRQMVVVPSGGRALRLASNAKAI